jgi:hypothetical protein
MHNLLNSFLNRPIKKGDLKNGERENSKETFSGYESTPGVALESQTELMETKNWDRCVEWCKQA